MYKDKTSRKAWDGWEENIRKNLQGIGFSVRRKNDSIRTGIIRVLVDTGLGIWLP